MYGTLYALCRAQSPGWQPATSYASIPWPRVLLALFATQAALLACAGRMLASPSITWSGVRYTRAAGRVRVASRA